MAESAKRAGNSNYSINLNEFSQKRKNLFFKTVVIAIFAISQFRFYLK